MNKVNVIFGGSTFVTMRESDLLNNNIIQFFSNFNCVFSVANLSKIDDFKVVLPKGVYSEKIEYSFEDKINKLDEAINNNEDIRIWTSHYDIESYLLFLYLCNYLKDRDCNLYVVYSDEYDKDCYSPACMKKEELESLSKLEHKLSKLEITEHSKEWVNLKNNTSDIRILEDKKLKLVSYDYYNEEILNLLKELGEVKIVKLAGSFMNNNYLQCLLVSFLIDRLIEDKKIKIIKYGDRFFENIIDENI